MSRAVPTEIGRRPVTLIVTLTAAGIELRQKRHRTAYLLPYPVALYKAAGIAADAARRERNKGRRTRRGLLHP